MRDAAAFEAIIMLVVCIGLLVIAWRDFQTFTISNRSVLVLLALSALAAAFGGVETLPSRLGAGGLLFVLGFGFWAAGLMGAGDAKLMAPVGILLGWGGLAPFAVGLLAFSVAALVLVKLPPSVFTRWTVISSRLAEIREEGVFPYGVPIALAAVSAALI